MTFNAAFYSSSQGSTGRGGWLGTLHRAGSRHSAILTAWASSKSLSTSKGVNTHHAVKVEAAQRVVEPGARRGRALPAAHTWASQVV